MEFLGLVLIGCFVGLTTVFFGFGGGFVTVPIITLVDADLGRLIGGLPIIVFLRRRVPKIPEILHAWGYFVLLVAAGVVVAVA